MADRVILYRVAELVFQRGELGSAQAVRRSRGASSVLLAINLCGQKKMGVKGC